jgi:hypothetical protein
MKVSSTYENKCEKSNMDFHEEILMQTAITDVANPFPNEKKKLSIRLILDTGSQKTYITEYVFKKLGLVAKHYEVMSVSVFGGHKEKNNKKCSC